MENFVFILEFLSGLILLFAASWLIGKLLKLDAYYDAFQQEKTRIQKKK